MDKKIIAMMDEEIAAHEVELKRLTEARALLVGSVAEAAVTPVAVTVARTPESVQQMRTSSEEAASSRAAIYALLADRKPHAVADIIKAGVSSGMKEGQVRTWLQRAKQQKVLASDDRGSYRLIAENTQQSANGPTNAIRRIMSDGAPHKSDEIAAAVAKATDVKLEEFNRRSLAGILSRMAKTKEKRLDRGRYVLVQKRNAA